MVEITICFYLQVADLFVSFGKPESDSVEEEEDLSPGMQQIIGKLEQQEKRFVHS